MIGSTTNDTISRVAFVGNYLPRKCGIATFTTHLSQAIALQYPNKETAVFAINDQPIGYEYPDQVRFELAQDDLGMYENAADFINLHHYDVVSLQHEFGIFGGKAGSHILSLLRGLKVPVVTTLHTVLIDPDPRQRSVMNQLSQLSQRLVVMS